VDDTVDVTVSGKVTFQHGAFMTTAQLPAYRGIEANMYVFAARNGSEDAWIDNVCINDPGNAVTAVVTPHAVTINECSAITLTSQVTGSPPISYQWYRNGVAIPGAVASCYTTPTLLRADTGATYKLVAQNLFSTAQDSGVVTVTPDNVPPHLVSASVCSPTTVRVNFDKLLDPASADTAGHYTISGGVTVSAAVLQVGGKSVLLTVSGLTSGGCYLLSVNGVTDSCPLNPVPPGSSVVIRNVPIASGPQNLVVIEAEEFDANNKAGGLTWLRDNTFPGYSGAGYAVVLPDNGQNAGNVPLVPAVYADYCINFTTAGTYYFWVRGSTRDSAGGGNSLHIALDGANPNADTGNRIGNNINDWGGTCGPPLSWGWVNNSAVTGGPSSVAVPTPGLHMFRIWFREDVKLDQFVLTTDPAFAIGTCDAPLAATGRGPQLTVVHNGNGSVTVTWSGSGCRLQCTSTLGPNANWQDVATSSPYQVNGPTGNRFYRLITP